MSDPVYGFPIRLLQAQSGTYTATLQDETGTPVSGSTLQGLTLTLYDVATEAIINDRDAQDVLNASQVTVDGDGVLTWKWLAADVPIVKPGRELEEHVALFCATWTDGSGTPRQANRQVHFYVTALPGLTL